MKTKKQLEKEMEEECKRNNWNVEEVMKWENEDSEVRIDVLKATLTQTNEIIEMIEDWVSNYNEKHTWLIPNEEIKELLTKIKGDDSE